MKETAEQEIQTPHRSGFAPKIVAFCCHYCAYTAADMAGAAGDVSALGGHGRAIRGDCH